MPLMVDDEISELTDKVKRLEGALDKAINVLFFDQCPNNMDSCGSYDDEKCKRHWNKWLKGE